MTPRNERELAALAFQFLGDSRVLTAPESALETSRVEVTKREVEALRTAIREGQDPLGVEFLRLRSPEERRTRGAVYTPPAIVDAMVDWALRERGDFPARVVDPGSGSGRFLFAAATAFPNAELVAVDIDPLATLILRANAAALGVAGRLSVFVGDYRTLGLAPIRGRTLFIGNPPYVRHHQISDDAKAWFGEAAMRLGIHASKLAGLHVHFFLRTRELARLGDFGTFITSSEWMDVNYGSILRTMLTDGLGGTSLHVINPAAQAFEDAMTTSVIACFRLGGDPTHSLSVPFLHWLT